MCVRSVCAIATTEYIALLAIPSSYVSHVMADTKVTAWLRDAGLSRFISRFAAAYVTASDFVHLSYADFGALGVDTPADRKRLSDLIAQIRRVEGGGDKKPVPRASTQLAVSGRSTGGDCVDSESALKNVCAEASRADMTMARVVVCVRKRPLSRKEIAAGDRDVVTVQSDFGGLYVHELKEKVDLTKYVDTHAFQFDRVFGERASNAAVYERTAKPLVDALFGGGRATCFAYGQTGAGKTFTMAGDSAENPGLYSLAVKDMFERIRQTESDLWRKAEAEGNDEFEPPEPVQVWISFYEIYASRLQDLLNRSAKLECREDSNNEVQIVGLTERLCEVEEDVLACIDEGSAARSTGITGANDDSSRSHAVFQIELRQPPSEALKNDSPTAMRPSLLRSTRSRTAAAAQARRGVEIGRLCFIDLAGSERGSDTSSSTRQTRMEGAEINKSLLALKECIRAMDQKKDHTPFRGSKLTQVLKASFIGKDCSTVMIANISPASSNVEHTLNTLRYSDRVKEIKKGRNTPPPPDFDLGEAKTGMGSRRATFSHGIGLRGGRGLLGATSLKTTQRQTSFDAGSEDMDKFPNPPATERKISRSQFRTRHERSSQLEKTGSRSALKRTGSLGSPGRRVLQRGKSKDSESSPQGPCSGYPQSDLGRHKKSRDGRTIRRKTSRAPSMIPSRPSIGSNTVLKPDKHSSKTCGEGGRVPRQSRSKASSSSDLSTFTTRSERPTKPLGVNNSQPKRARLLSGNEAAASNITGSEEAACASTAYTPAILFAAAIPDSCHSSGSRSPPPYASTQSVDSAMSAEYDKHPTSPIPQQQRGSRAASAAQSAMKYYTTSKKDELREEDLLFASSENIIDEITAAEQERLCRVADEIGERGAAALYGRSDQLTGAPDDNNNSRRSSIRTDGGTSPPTHDDKSADESLQVIKRQGTAPSNVSPELKRVLRFHHVQIEELMRLTESDVALINAAEKGQMDADEYALKLKLNLSQKLDIVTALQSKLRLLE